ncbi:MAG: hypothetical protein KatS3mg088_697 [Patescibacteria group bacterium]|nr:MAG: hypothetical protein KatS3mg088_697 [Patescibacteria group bacterium]
MTFWVYILESLKNGRRYIGTSSNPKKRLEQHNLGKTRSTKPYIPYKIIHLEKFETKKQALIRERKLKSYKGGEALKKLIK